MGGIGDDPGALAGATGAADAIAGQRSDPNNIGKAHAPALRPYQTDVIARVWAASETGQRRIILVAPTGSGKTVVAADFVREARRRGQCVLFLAHRRELIGQASRKL